jgi:type II secretory pathway component PulM
MTRIRAALAGEAGEGLITGLILVAGVLVPLMFIVPLFERIETAHLAVEQAARDAVRAATLAPDAGQAQSAAQLAFATSRAQSSVALQGSLTGSFARGSLLTAQASASVQLLSLPGLASLGTITVHGRASAPVDRYRSLPRTAGGP